MGTPPADDPPPGDRGPRDAGAPADDAPGPHPINRRRHTRTDLAAPARLAGPGGWDVPGRATSLAFGGALFVPDAPGVPVPAAGEGATLTLHAPEADGPIVFTCRVARASATGIGLKFLATDPAGFERFADLIVLGAEGSGRLVEELRVSPAFEVATGEGLRRALD
jgi:PilZ domain